MKKYRLTIFKSEEIKEYDSLEEAESDAEYEERVQGNRTRIDEVEE